MVQVGVVSRLRVRGFDFTFAENRLKALVLAPEDFSLAHCPRSCPQTVSPDNGASKWASLLWVEAAGTDPKQSPGVCALGGGGALLFGGNMVLVQL